MPSSRSKTFAAWIFALSTSPWVSTSRWRLECPSPSCQHRSHALQRLLSSGRLDALAVDNAGGAGLWVLLPKRTRALRRSASCSSSQVPSLCARRGGSNGRRSSRVGSRHAGASARCSRHAPHRRQSVEDLAQRVHPGASGSSRDGEVGLDQGPLGVGEIGLVCSSHLMPGILPGHHFTIPFQTVS